MLFIVIFSLKKLDERLLIQNHFTKMFDSIIPDNISFTTSQILYRNIKGSRIYDKFPITPSWSIVWNYKILSIFLNQMPNFKPDNIRATRNYSGKSETYRTFNFIDDFFGYSLVVYIYYKNNFEIKVFVNERTLKKMFTEINEGNFRFSYKLDLPNLNETSTAILNSETLAFFDINDFSPIFNYFINIMKSNLPKNRFTCFLHEFSKIYIKRPSSRSIINLQNLKIKTQGYLKILTIDRQFSHLFKLYKDQNLYALRGCYISPFAKSILQNKEKIDGIMIDGTFKILKNYVTCFILLIIQNTGIPVGFTFSYYEDQELFDLVFDTFFEILNEDLSIYTVESDQGKTIISSCKNHGCHHIFCLRHFLAKLHKLKYGFQGEKLVSCKCMKDFETLTKKFNANFQTFSAGEKTTLNNTLSRLGMKFINNEITIVDTDLWSSVSMIQRSTFCMPSTTNAIESIHGHLNEAIPRNNCFFSSLYRIILTINSQIHRFQEKHRHNYGRIIREIKKKALNNPFIKNECDFYQTTLFECKCGETILYSKMYRIDIPCSHRIHLGCQFPILSDIELKYEKLFQELILDIQDDKKYVQKKETEYIKEIAAKNIKRYSHSKKEDIVNFVEEHFHPTYTEFALGYPIEFFDVISSGIEFFTK